jgi:hypothetical protein
VSRHDITKPTGSGDLAHFPWLAEKAVDLAPESDAFKDTLEKIREKQGR